MADGKWAIALHGGAGTILKEDMTPEKEEAYTKALEESLAAGRAILKAGGDALEAAAATVESLEDCLLFNAGRGSVFTAEGQHEMEASMMCGQTLQAGAVAQVKLIKNPIRLAEKVLHDEQFVMLAGKGAEQYAKDEGIAFEQAEYFFSNQRHREWEALRNTRQLALDHSDKKKFGTVGAVALDQAGNLAAATSTGGLTNKRYGRLGDSSVIGSGTYANNRSCAVSCTGWGEYFLRGVVAYDVSALMEYGGLSLKEACDRVVMEKQLKMGSEGGLIAVDTVGNISLCFNSEGMYRGEASSAMPAGKVAIYR